MFGYVRIAAGIPKLQVADCSYNSNEIIKLILEAEKKCVDIISFPELSVTGYTCADLFLQISLLEGAENAVFEILKQTKNIDVFATIGVPIRVGHKLFNCAVAIYKGKILGIVPKLYLPNYNEFYESRWFNSGIESEESEVKYCGQMVPFGYKLIFSCENKPDLKIGIEICEDLWAVIPPSSHLALEGATVILNLSASNELSGKENYRRTLIEAQSAKTYTTYCYANCGSGESTTDVVFSGHSLIYEKGILISENKKFVDESQLIYSDSDIEVLIQERLKTKSFRNLLNHETKSDYKYIKFHLEDKDRNLDRIIESLPFVPKESPKKDERCQEIYDIQVAGLSKRIVFTNVNKAIIGISGGLDSTLALLGVVKTFDFIKKDRKDIIGITMPGFGTTDRTYKNAIELMKSLGVSYREISIKEACLLHFKDIGHDPENKDVTYENVQARERTQILMDISNKENGLVVGTGDLSEIALGWSTYNGDHMSMYAINCGIPKTLIKSLVLWISKQTDETTKKILEDIVLTPVSPELLPPSPEGEIKQKTEDIIGPYELHDFFLYYHVRYGLNKEKIIFLAKNSFGKQYSKKEINKWIDVFYKRFFTQQFKRSCMPDGPKVGSVALSPRGDWKMPSDARYDLWVK